MSGAADTDCQELEAVELHPSPVCAVCERPYFIESAYVDGMCRTCGFVAHCEGY